MADSRHSGYAVRVCAPHTQPNPSTPSLPGCFAPPPLGRGVSQGLIAPETVALPPPRDMSVARENPARPLYDISPLSYGEGKTGTWRLGRAYDAPFIPENRPEMVNVQGCIMPPVLEAQKYLDGGNPFTTDSAPQRITIRQSHHEDNSRKLINHTVLAVNCIMQSKLENRSDPIHVLQYDELVSSARLSLSRLLSFVEGGAVLRLGAAVHQWLDRTHAQAHSDAGQRAEWIRMRHRASSGLPQL